MIQASYAILGQLLLTSDVTESPFTELLIRVWNHLQWGGDLCGCMVHTVPNTVKILINVRAFILILCCLEKRGVQLLEASSIWAYKLLLEANIVGSCETFVTMCNILTIQAWKSVFISWKFPWNGDSYTVKPDLKTTSIKRPPLLRIHFQILPRVITIILTCIKRPPVFKDQRPHFCLKILSLRDYTFFLRFAFYVITYFTLMD